MDIKINKGVIFKNTKKTSDKHPEYRGEINVETPGLKEISLWVNTDKNGNKYFSVGISEPYSKPEPDWSQHPAKFDKVEMIDDVPDDSDNLPFIITILLAVGSLLTYL